MPRSAPARLYVILCALIVASTGLLGCDSLRREPFCQLGVEHEVDRTRAKDIDGVELVALTGRSAAFWSEPGGLFGRALDIEGAPTAKPRRIGPRCDGGLAALASGRRIDLVCLVRPLREKPDAPGGVLWLQLDADLALLHSQLVGSAGDLSEGVALARGASGLELAWHDGSPLGQRVWWTLLGAGPPAPRVVSEAGRVASAPALAVSAGRSLLVWAETWVERGILHSRLAAWDRVRGTRTLRELKHLGAMPRLFALGSDFALGFRDLRPGTRTGLYLATMRGGGARLGEPRRAGRADGVARPALEPCMGGVVAATPRTFAGDYFVGVNWLDSRLQRVRGEQQFYQDSHAFTQVAAACAGDHALLLISEFPQLQRESTALRVVPYRCR